jgi:hypothetical protein
LVPSPSQAGDRAGELGREGRALAAIGLLGEDEAVADLERGLEAVGEAIAELG